MKKSGLMFIVLLAGGFAFADEKLDAIKAKATTEATEFSKAVLGNKSVIDAILASNKKYPGSAQRTGKAPVEGIDAKDKIWTDWFKADKLAKSKNAKAPAMPALVSGVVKSPCSEALRAAKAKDKAISEVFIMDRLGATVCAAEATSDFDQGDEDKWLEPFVNGVNPHVGSPSRDASSDTFQTQVSMVIENGGQKIGVMTVGTLVSQQVASN
jgi:hypothetical protein